MGVIALCILIGVMGGVFAQNSNSIIIVTGEEAAKNVVDFSKNEGMEATLISIADKNILYEITVEVNKQKFPVYVTKDGNYMLNGLVPLKANSNKSDLDFGTNIINAEEAAKSVIDFSQSQGLVASVINSSYSEPLFNIYLEMNNQKLSVYVIQGGNYMATGLINLKSNLTNPTDPVTPKPIPKSDKPKVELFTLAYSPYAIQAEKGIIPVILALDRKTETKIVFLGFFMHGDKEEIETYNQVCIREEQKDSFYDYLSCFTRSGNSLECIKSERINEDKLNQCLADNYKRAKEYYRVDNKTSNSYGVQGSPALFINGVEVNGGRDSSS